ERFLDDVTEARHGSPPVVGRQDRPPPSSGVGGRDGIIARGGGRVTRIVSPRPAAGGGRPQRPRPRRRPAPPAGSSARSWSVHAGETEKRIDHRVTEGTEGKQTQRKREDREGGQFSL